MKITIECEYSDFNSEEGYKTVSSVQDPTVMTVDEAFDIWKRAMSGAGYYMDKFDIEKYEPDDER